jgi:lipoprotein NlpD
MRLGGILLLGFGLVGGGCATASLSSARADERASPGPPGRTIVVQRGDTLTRIAAAHDIAIDDIVEVNGLDSADSLAVGQRLFLPAGVAPPPPEQSGPDTAPPSMLDDDRGATAALPVPPAAATPLVWPVDGVVLRDFAASQPATAKRPARDGFDGVLIAAPAGTPVRAAAGGIVAFAGTQGTANGNFVVVEHADGLVSVYAHLKTIGVSVGQTVAAGDVVGEIGTSGLSGVSPRVQLQVRRDQRPVDPLPLLPP